MQRVNVNKDKKQTRAQKKKAKRAIQQGQIPRPPRRAREPTRVRAVADPRMGKNGMTRQLALANQTLSLVMSVGLEQDNLEQWAAGFVTKAMEKGFAAKAEAVAYPWYAYVFIVETLRTLIGNGAVTVTNVPYCLLALARALRPKTVAMSNGSISYSAILSAAIEPTIQKTVGYNAYGYQWGLGWADPSLTPVNGFPKANFTVAVYGAADGAKAFQQMCLVLQTPDKLGPNRSVPLIGRTSMDFDVSAFSVPSDRVGLGAAGEGSGGTCYTIGLEVPIKSPQFAAINNTVFIPGSQNRFSVCPWKTVGDGFYLGAAMASFWEEKMWFSKRYPKFHFVDFLEFADVIARWVAGIQQACASDPNNVALVPSTLRCSITLLEMQLLLRNVMMQAYKDTQASVQSTYPIVPVNGNANEFVPFISSSSTCYLAPVDLRLPIPLIENIRALVARYVQRTNTDYEWFVPVLGQYANDELDEDDYTYVGQDMVTYPCFADSATLFMKKIFDEEKNTSSMKVSAETPIQLVDGFSSTGYVFINDPARLKILAADWSLWLSTNGLDNYSTDLGLLGTEEGINALVSVNFTRHWVLTPLQRKTDDRLVDTRKSTTMRANYGSPYEDREAIADSQQSDILSTAYEQIQSVWILPQIKQVVNVGNSTLNPRWQAIMGETFEASSSSGFDGETLASLHSSYALKMVRGKLSKATDWEQLFSTLAAAGRGGILSGLVAKFANAIIPGAGGIVTTIGDAIGI